MEVNAWWNNDTVEIIISDDGPGIPPDLLNRIGEPIHITTGRRISEGLPDNINDVIVMLDAECSFKHVNDSEIDIYWGAYLGTDDEILVSGNLKGLTHDIERIRSEAKGKKGWIMDTYLLRRTTSAQ